MAFEVQEKKDHTLITSGVEKLDSSCAPDLKSKFVYLNKQGVRNIILDLSKTRYCDSSGLSSILVAHRLCKEANGSFILASLQDSVQKLIDISQLNNVLKITPTYKEAVDLLQMEEVERDVDKGNE